VIAPSREPGHVAEHAHIGRQEEHDEEQPTPFTSHMQEQGQGEDHAPSTRRMAVGRSPGLALLEENAAAVHQVPVEGLLDLVPDPVR
jgi:hypothetical protein